MKFKTALKLISSDINARCQMVKRKNASFVDYCKVFFDHHLLPVVLYRIYHWLYLHGFRFAACFLKFLNITLFKVEIGENARIGPGLVFAHANFIVISDHCIIGKNLILTHHNTLCEGYNSGKDKNFLLIGDDVTVGAGACIMGAIIVGSNVTIAANSTVAKNIPESHVVIGTPAKSIKKRV